MPSFVLLNQNTTNVYTISGTQLNNQGYIIKAIYPTKATLTDILLLAFFAKFIPWYSLPKCYSGDFTSIS